MWKVIGIKLIWDCLTMILHLLSAGLLYFLGKRQWSLTLSENILSHEIGNCYYF